MQPIQQIVLCVYAWSLKFIAAVVVIVESGCLVICCWYVVIVTAMLLSQSLSRLCSKEQYFSLHNLQHIL